MSYFMSVPLGVPAPHSFQKRELQQLEKALREIYTKYLWAENLVWETDLKLPL